ncbi:MAG: DUF126 domain-containing protein [Candidatus Micrarchaeota archaeon]
MEIKCRTISKGTATGKVLLSKDPISFLGGVDPETGIVMEEGHSIQGKCIADTVLVFPRGKGSTVGSYVMLQLAKNKKAPSAIVNVEAEPIISVGAIISKIPMVDKPETDLYKILTDGMTVEVNGNEGTVTIQED